MRPCLNCPGRAVANCRAAGCNTSVPQPAWGRPRRYCLRCSPRRRALSLLPRSLVCYCGTTIVVVHPGQRFCSRTCQVRQQARQPCVGCGTLHYRGAKTGLCRRCHVRSRRPGPTLCLGCGRPIARRQLRDGRTGRLDGWATYKHCGACKRPPRSGPRPCAHCKRIFVPSRLTGPRPRWCSRACRRLDPYSQHQRWNRTKGAESAWLKGVRQRFGGKLPRPRVLAALHMALEFDRWKRGRRRQATA